MTSYRSKPHGHARELRDAPPFCYTKVFMGLVSLKNLFIVCFLICLSGCVNSARPTETNEGETIGGYVLDVDKTLFTLNDEFLRIEGPPGTVHGKRICMADVSPAMLSDYRDFALIHGHINYSLDTFSPLHIGHISINADGSFSKQWSALQREQYLQLIGDQERLIVLYLPESSGQLPDPLLCSFQFQAYLNDEFPTAGYIRIIPSELEELNQDGIRRSLKTLFED